MLPDSERAQSHWTGVNYRPHLTGGAGDRRHAESPGHVAELLCERRSCGIVALRDPVGQS